MSDMPSGPKQATRARVLSGPRAATPKRRTFTAAYKRRIIEQYDALTDPAERGALLRREGLYHSHLEYWRAARDKMPPTDERQARGRPPRSAAEVENERLRSRREAGCRAHPDQSGIGRRGKSVRALGDALRERGFRPETERVIDAALTEFQPFISTSAACRLLENQGPPAPAAPSRAAPETRRQRPAARRGR